MLGLAAAALLAFAVSPLPYVGRYVLLPLFLIFGYVFAIVGARRARAILRLVGINPARFESAPGERSPTGTAQARRHLGDHRRAHRRHRRHRASSTASW